MSLHLGELKVNESGRIVGFGNLAKAYRHKLLTMGLTKGCEIKVLRVAPLGDPMEISVKGYHLSLRKGEASVVLVEKIEGKA